MRNRAKPASALRYPFVADRTSSPRLTDRPSATEPFTSTHALRLSAVVSNPINADGDNHHLGMQLNDMFGGPGHVKIFGGMPGQGGTANKLCSSTSAPKPIFIEFLFDVGMPERMQIFGVGDHMPPLRAENVKYLVGG